MPTSLARMALACLALLPLARAQDKKDSTAPKPPDPVTFLVTPAPEPVPALKYRLVPIHADLNPGDAAPIYLRIRHEVQSDNIKAIGTNEGDWINRPLDKFPKEEARKFVEGWAGKLRQIEFGTRRQECNWNYTLPEEPYNAIEILLPDAQEMRNWARLLGIKARLEVAEGKYEDALRTIQTGIAFGRHVGGGPFLINALLGTAIVSGNLTRLEELIGQPGAPNLYWALTALPDPVVPLRNALEIEQRLGELMIPELREPETALSAAEWSVRLAKLFEHTQNLTRKLVAYEEGGPALKLLEKIAFAAYKAELLKEARPWLVAHGSSQKNVDAMSDDEAALRYVVGKYQTLRDSTYKASYLPYTGALAVLKEAQKANQAEQTGPLATFATIFPAIETSLGAQARMARRVAALRCVEAVRMHAAANDGSLPKSLDEVKLVPVPVDPILGVPFEYTVKEDAAVLKAPGFGNQPHSSLEYRISIRK